MKRLKIAVLFGGCSPEYSVSLQSAAAVLQNMDSSKYEAVMVGIPKMGDWYSYTGPIENIKNDTFTRTPGGQQTVIVKSEYPCIIVLLDKIYLISTEQIWIQQINIMRIPMNLNGWSLND